MRKVGARPPKEIPSKKECTDRLATLGGELDELQRMLYAYDRYAVLLIFQAMDAGGKDSTIRAVMSRVNPAGCQVFSFKQPSSLSLDHDFLWRTTRCLPERGRIGIFNRSYYEEVLVVRVHPELLQKQKLPQPINLRQIWPRRYESIRNHEKHLAENGTIILKFWLNVSKEEQKRRFLSRLSEPQKYWKFSAADLAERKLWGKYMKAYEAALKATSRPWAPWYAIPADDKPFMRVLVAEIIVKTLRGLSLRYPPVTKKQKAKFSKLQKNLEKGN
ncbi:MAG: polyphosphate kinase 2 family protein [Nitrospirales bacterium]|nr:polyphosphate kinase 2 family protein [Nitrospirales bacterium]